MGDREQSPTDRSACSNRRQASKSEMSPASMLVEAVNQRMNASLSRAAARENAALAHIVLGATSTRPKPQAATTNTSRAEPEQPDQASRGILRGEGLRYQGEPGRAARATAGEANETEHTVGERIMLMSFRDGEDCRQGHGRQKVSKLSACEHASKAQSTNRLKI
eukprot:gene24612-205_t